MKVDTGDLELGELLRVYKSRVWNYRLAVFTSTGIVLILLIFVGTANIYGISHFQLVPVYAIGGMLAALPVVGLVYQLKHNARFYERGLVYENRRSTTATRWADVRDVWESSTGVDADGVTSPGQLLYHVRTVNGPTISFSPRRGDPGEFGAFLKAQAIRWGVPIRMGIPPGDRPAEVWKLQETKQTGTE